jgi:CubicO group peptidase (beta-lactamase class C family)
MLKKYFKLISIVLLFISQYNLKATTKNNNTEILSENFMLKKSFNDNNFKTEFKFYKNQGYILISSNELDNLTITLNNTDVKIDKNLKNKKNMTTIDISQYTTNGKNILSISKKLNNNNLVELNIPYPSIITLNKQEYMDKNKEKDIDNLINQDIKNGFPGATLIVVKNGQIIKNSAYGYSKRYDKDGKNIKNPTKTTTNTIFDLASNTKMYAANYAIQTLVYQNKLSLDSKISDFFPEFKDPIGAKIKGKNKITIADLLYHKGGLPADPQIHNKEIGKDLYSTNKLETLQAMNKLELEYPVGSKHQYSDADYILLGLIVEKITNTNLDDYMEQNLYIPLNLLDTKYNPLQKGVNKNQIAQLDLQGNSRDSRVFFEGIRQYTIQGEVEDEKAYHSMNGVSGHAGLFSSGKNLAILMQIMLNGGGYDKYQLFDMNTINTFKTPSNLNPSFGMGWRLSYNQKMQNSFSKYASENTIGHSGWAGTFTLIDFDNDLLIILLTNKKHTKVLDTPQNQEVLTTGCNFTTKECYNKYEGDNYNTGKYGLIMEKVYLFLK